MASVMVTGRMPEEKKAAGNEVLYRSGMNASQAINRMFDLLIERQNADFLQMERGEKTADDWARAALFVDSLRLPWEVDFNLANLPKSELKEARLHSKGLM